MLRAPGDDRLRGHRADVGQRLELGLGRGVEVDQGPPRWRRQRGRPTPPALAVWGLPPGSARRPPADAGEVEGRQVHPGAGTTGRLEGVHHAGAGVEHRDPGRRTLPATSTVTGAPAAGGLPRHRPAGATPGPAHPGPRVGGRGRHQVAGGCRRDRGDDLPGVAAHHPPAGDRQAEGDQHGDHGDLPRAQQDPPPQRLRHGVRHRRRRHAARRAGPARAPGRRRRPLLPPGRWSRPQGSARLGLGSSARGRPVRPARSAPAALLRRGRSRPHRRQLGAEQGQAAGDRLLVLGALTTRIHAVDARKPATRPVALRRHAGENRGRSRAVDDNRPGRSLRGGT